MHENLQLDRLLTEREASEFLGFSPRALQSWRYKGEGPKHVRISHRAIRYRLRDLFAWTEERIRTSTKDEALGKND